MQTEPKPDPLAFDRLMRGLTAVPKAELEAEIAKEEREKAKAEKEAKAKK
ncbi:MAG: hypothetical protein AAF710_00355 [Planctomycetota bacterium]